MFDPLLDGKYFYPILRRLVILHLYDYWVIYKIASITNCVKYSLPTRMGLVIFLCSNSNHLISLIPMNCLKF